MPLLLWQFSLVPAGHVSRAEERPRQGESASAFATGQKDATEFLQQLVDSSHGDIELPKGTYRISRPITVDLAKAGWTAWHGRSVVRIVMTGPGPALRFVGTHRGTAAPHTVEPHVWSRQRAPMVDGIEIVGEHPEACGIEAAGTMQLTLTRLVVRDVFHGIHLRRRNRNVVLSDCHVYHNRGAGLFLDEVNLHQINVTGCHISYNAGGGIVSLKSELRNLQVTGCDIEGNMGEADSKPTANIWLDSQGASIGEVAVVGCTIQHTHAAPASANIRINGRSRRRPFTEELRHGHVTIGDNVLSDAQYNIDLVDCRNVIVTGNSMWKGYTRSLRMRRCADVVVSDNVLDRNPRYRQREGNEAVMAVELLDSQRCLFNGNIIQEVVHAEAAMIVRRCRNIQITDCILTNYGRCGILWEDVARSQIAGCLFEEPRNQFASAVPIRVIGGADNVVEHNRSSHSPELDAESILKAEGNLVFSD